MSGQTKVRLATDHLASVRSGYCPIGLRPIWLLPVGQLFLGLMSGRAVVRQTAVLSGYCPSGMCPRGSVRRASVRSGYCPGTVL